MFLQLFLLTALAGDPASGPAAGEALPDFKTLGFSGAEAGKEYTVLKIAGKGPLAIVFVQKLTRPALRLFRPVDDFAANNEKLTLHFVWVTGNKDDTLAFLKRAQNSLKLQAPISVALDGKDGLEKMGLNDRAAVTILLVRDQKVVSNFALADPNETDAPKVIDALKKLVGKSDEAAK